MVDETTNRQGRSDVAAHIVAAALLEPAFASLARAGAPVVVAEGDPARVIHANGAALALFAVADCDGLTHRLFASDEPAARRLAHLAQAILPGAAARLERLSLRFDLLPETVTFLCRRTAGENPLFILAGLGLRAGQPRVRGPVLSKPSAAPLTESLAETPHPEPPPPPVAAQSPLVGLRDALQRRFPGLAPARFLWRTDAANIVTEITPSLADIVGAGCAALVGRDMAEAAGALGLDSHGELARVLRARATFSGIEVDWPIEQAGAVAPVTLGGLPAFGAGHAFDGWRGFGVIHLDRLREGPLFAPPLSAPSSPTVPPEAILPPEPAPVAPLEFSGVVVPLRPLQTRPVAPAEPPEAETRPDEHRKPAPARDDDSVLVTLAPHERNAFREIARTLGARGDSAGGGGASPDFPRELGEAHLRPTAHLTEAPTTPDESGGEAILLDALPIGLLVMRDGKAIFANRPLLGWLGFADLAAFERSGGLRAACRNATLDWPTSERRTLLLRSAEGASFAADVQRANAAWEGAPAELFALTRPASAALEQRVGVLEAALRQREKEAEETLAILDTAADGFVLLNAEGAILGLNRPAEALLGYSRNQVAGENFTRLLTRESHVAAIEYFARMQAGEEKGGRDVFGRTRQGGVLPLHLSFGRLDKPAGDKFCAVLRDMSQWKKAEGAMEEARAQAERDSQAKSEFLAKVSHEIRTPLNAILGFAEVIMDERFGPVGNERYRDYLKDIHASGAHVMSLVNDLLDLSKIEAGKLELAFAAVDANRVVAECVSLIQPQANREKVITRLALAPRLPAILADERSLRQIVLNLLANAVRYNEPGGQVIVSTALNDSGHAVLRVKDTGIGMSEKELETALEPFRQVNPSRGGGAGLGLPLTKALAEANHAGFAIRSRKSEGTLVEITFALAPEAVESASVAGKAG
jgi:PAS domain S-box-containing protein